MQIQLSGSKYEIRDIFDTTKSNGTIMTHMPISPYPAPDHEQRTNAIRYPIGLGNAPPRQLCERMGAIGNTTQGNNQITEAYSYL